MKKSCFLITPLILLLLLSISQAADKNTHNAPQIILNDTGLNWCANLNEFHLDCPVGDFPNQDAEYGRDLLAEQGRLRKTGGGHAGFDFTKLDDKGEPLPANAKQWTCVRDNHTGLEWETKTADGGLQHNLHTYSWYEPDPKRNGGNPGIQNGGRCDGSACDTLAYVAAINQQGLCGHSDWRLPGILELHSIVDYSRVNPAIDSAYFPDIPTVASVWNSNNYQFWSATSHGGSEDSAKIVNFTSGEIFFRQKKDPITHIRLVRGRRLGWQGGAQ